MKILIKYKLPGEKGQRERTISLHKAESQIIQVLMDNGPMFGEELKTHMAPHHKLQDTRRRLEGLLPGIFHTIHIDRNSVLYYLMGQEDEARKLLGRKGAGKACYKAIEEQGHLHWDYEAQR